MPDRIRSFPVLPGDEKHDVQGFTVLITACADPRQKRLIILGAMGALLFTGRYMAVDTALLFAEDYVSNYIERVELPPMAA